jgi:uncharacterized membrane protein
VIDNPFAVMNKLSQRTGRSRILSVDSMRGLAMILVILQHAYHLIDPAAVQAQLDLAIYTLTRSASVAFMAVSGMMIAYFMASRADWKTVQRRFARRAVFLLLFAHAAIILIRYYYVPEDRFNEFVRALYYQYQITDTIALSLLIAPLLLRYVKPSGRLLLIVALLAVTPAVAAFPLPESNGLAIFRIALFGEIIDEHPINVGWPLIPWLAIFLCGSAMGEGLAAARSGSISIPQLIRRMRRIAMTLAAIGIALSIAYKLVKIAYGDVWDPRIFLAVYPSRTTALLPVYLAFLLWIFSWLLSRIDVRQHYDRAAWFASVLGRTSLFTYVIQFAFVHTIPALLGLRGHINLWQYLVLFAVGLSLTWLCSFTYGRLRGWITPRDFARIQAELSRSDR